MYIHTCSNMLTSTYMYIHVHVHEHMHSTCIIGGDCRVSKWEALAVVNRATCTCTFVAFLIVIICLSNHVISVIAHAQVSPALSQSVVSYDCELSRCCAVIKS